MKFKINDNVSSGIEIPLAHSLCHSGTFEGGSASSCIVKVVKYCHRAIHARYNCRALLKHTIIAKLRSRRPLLPPPTKLNTVDRKS